MSASDFGALDVFDVLIVGGALVGASCALALRQQGLRIGLIDAAPPPSESMEWDSRIYALSPSSVQFLDELGAWSLLDAARVTRCTSMQVFGDALNSKIEFLAYDVGVSALSFMVEARALARSLAARIADSHITVFKAACTRLDVNADRAQLMLADGKALSASLVVGADGASSWVRRSAGLVAKVLDYEQMGLVANFETSKPHNGCAYQWFRADGVLAFLPLPERRMSMVWSTEREHAQILLDLPPETLSERVSEAGRGALGELNLITPPRSFPLQRLSVSDVAGERVVLVGDAAHVIHPLAGQGANLGFSDARDLASTLGAREKFRHCGDARLLRRYGRARREDILVTRSLTHGLQRLFARGGPIPPLLRNTGLNFLNATPVIKTLLARRALG